MRWLLIRQLKSSDVNKKLKAIKKLEKIGTTEVVDHLITTLAHDNLKVKIATIEALGTIKNTKAIEPLIKILLDKTEDVRIAANKSLDKIDQNWFKSESVQKYLPRFIDALKANNIAYVRDIIDKLGQFGYRLAVDQLLQLVESCNEKLLASISNTLSLLNWIPENQIDKIKSLILIMYKKGFLKNDLAKHDKNYWGKIIKRYSNVLNWKPDGELGELIDLCEQILNKGRKDITDIMPKLIKKTLPYLPKPSKIYISCEYRHSSPSNPFDSEYNDTYKDKGICLQGEAGLKEFPWPAEKDITYKSLEYGSSKESSKGPSDSIWLLNSGALLKITTKEYSYNSASDHGGYYSSLKWEAMIERMNVREFVDKMFSSIKLLSNFFSFYLYYAAFRENLSKWHKEGEELDIRLVTGFGRA